MINILAMSQSTKKFLIILAVLLLLIVVLIGLIASSIKSTAERNAKEIDLYLTDMCRFQILKSPKDVVNYVKKHEKKEFFKKNRWFLRIFILIGVAFVVLMAKLYENNYAGVLANINDLGFELTWPTAEFFGIKNFPVDWPELTKTPVVHIDISADNGLGWVSYIVLVVSILTLFVLAVNSINLAARISRAKKIKVDIFGKSVEYGSKNTL